jgi:hypothetical protein
VRQAHAEEATMFDRYHCRDRDQSTGVAALMFAMVCFAIMTVASTVAYICAHIWLVATIALRLAERQWFRAMAWTCILAVLIYIDVQLLGYTVNY